MSLSCTTYHYSAYLKCIAFFILAGIVQPSHAQNLFDNGGFETVNICIEYAAPCAPESWFNFKPNQIPTVNGRLAAKPLLGNNAFLLPIYDVNNKQKPLVYTMLLCPLKAGKQYKLSFYLYTAERPFYNIDFAFVNKSPVTVGFDPYAAIPDLKISGADIVATVKGWSAVERIFTATKDARFLILGNINSHADMRYRQSDGMNRAGLVSYFLDEMLLQPIIPESPCSQLEANRELMHAQDLRHTEYAVAEEPIPIDTPGILMDTLTLPAVLFKTGSAVIDPRFTNLLDSVIASLSRYQIKSLEVIGHTDNTGAYAQNLVLSRNRAKSVLDYITHKMGLVKVSYTGRADEVPVATNETVGGRSANRRVELIISYTTAP